MPEDQPYVVVHGGVHKTATSYIQSVLQRNAGHLRKRGVHYVHHRTTRKDFTVPCQLNEYKKIGLGFATSYTDDELDEITSRFFQAIEAGPGQRIILSDENMPGHCGHCVKRGNLYRWRRRLMAVFARQIPYPVTEVHLAVRNYADFFAAAYVEFLRSATAERVFPDSQMKQQVLSAMPNWTSFVNVVAKSFPDARISVWKHEDFRQMSGAVIQNICGPDILVEKLAEPKKKLKRPTASHRAINEIIIAIQKSGGVAGLEQRAEIQEKYPRGEDYAGYDPWTAQEREHLTRLYSQDLTELEKMDRVSLMKAEHA